MNLFKFLLDGWLDEEAYFVRAMSLIEAVSIFKYFCYCESIKLTKFTVEVIE